MKYLIVAIALVLTACGKNVVRSESTNTIVVDAFSVDKAIPLAEQSCKKKGLKFRLLKIDNYIGEYIFECY